MSKETIEFVSLCIEMYKINHKTSGKKVMEIFDEYGITEFLIDGYDALHTQSIQYVMEEIELYLKNRGDAEK